MGSKMLANRVGARTAVDSKGSKQCVMKGDPA